MHLAHAFIQSHLHCISRYTFTFLSVYSYLHSYQNPWP